MGQWQRFIFGSDVHGHEQNAEACREFFKFVDIWKPHRRIAGGDIWDFAPLRRKATEEEKRQSMQLDFAAGRRWLEKFQPTDFLRGNHDERLWDLQRYGAGIMQDYANQGVGDVEKLMRQLRCTMLPYDKRLGVVKLGRLNCIHGFSHGVYAARVAASVYGEVIMGHVHVSQTFSFPGFPNNRMGMSSGCLANIDFDYNRAALQSLAHNYGWICGVYNEKTGDYECWHVRKIGGVWLAPGLIS